MVTKDFYKGSPYNWYPYERFEADYWGRYWSTNIASGYSFYCTDGIVEVGYYDGSLMRDDPKYGMGKVGSALYKDMYDIKNGPLSSFLKKDIAELFENDD